MDNELPPIDTRPDEPPPIEDYEALGHTFLGGHGSRNPIIPATVITQEAREPLQVDWTKVIWWALGAAVIALALLVGGVIVAIVHHIHSARPAGAAAPSPHSGEVFAIVTVVVIALVGARALARFIRGE